MIVRYGGGNNGIAEYLENGMKQGRMFSRDELDQRLVLQGDLEFTNNIIQSIQDKGQERYLHITLSFKEDEVSFEKMQSLVDDYRNLLLSAYSEDEYNFYAEAHLPKIKQVSDNRTGESIERKPHIHIVIPEVNLVSQKKLSPVGLVELHERYLDSIQEHLNYKYNLESPKDNVRKGDMHYANVLSRVKGDFFGQKQQELKLQLIDDIAKGKINTLDEFQARLSDVGEVKVRNAGKSNQYFAVKIGDDKKFTNLNHIAFSESFIVNKTLPYTKPTPEQAIKGVQEWRSRVSREVKFIHSAASNFRKEYAQATDSRRVELLNEREEQYARKYQLEQSRHFQSRGREGNSQSDIISNQGGKPQAASRYAVGVPGLSIGNVVYGENQNRDRTQGILPENEFNHLRNGQTSNDSAMRRNDSSGASNAGTARRGDRRAIQSLESGSRGEIRGNSTYRANSNAGGSKFYSGNIRGANIRGRYSDISRRGYSDSINAPKSHFMLVSRGLPTQTYDRTIFNRDEYYIPIKTPFEAYEEALQKKSKQSSQFSESNSLSQLAKSQNDARAYQSDIEKFREIRQKIDPKAFLSHLERVYAINPNKYSVSYAKDGSPRFRVNKRNLNASDFLTKHLNLSWKEASSVLLLVYSNQTNKHINQEKLTSQQIARNIKAFVSESRRFEKDFKLVLQNMNVDNRNLYRLEKKRIYSRVSSQKVRNQELAIASFRAMQRQEQITAFEVEVNQHLENAKIYFQQSGYSDTALRSLEMGLLSQSVKDRASNLFNSNSDMGQISSAKQEISFTDNFAQVRRVQKELLKEQQAQQAARAAAQAKTALTQQQAEQIQQQTQFFNRSMDDVMKLNNIGISKRENGDIAYKRLEDGKTLFTDTGSQMLISKDMQNLENVKVFLELAVDRYGNDLNVKGSKEFKSMVIEVAAANNLPVTFKNAEMQDQLMKRRNELKLEQNAGAVTNDAQQALPEKENLQAKAEEVTSIKQPIENDLTNSQPEIKPQEVAQEKTQLQSEQITTNDVQEPILEQQTNDIDDPFGNNKLSVTEKVQYDLRNLNESYENYLNNEVEDGQWDYTDYSTINSSEIYNSALDEIDRQIKENPEYAAELYKQTKGDIKFEHSLSKESRSVLLVEKAFTYVKDMANNPNEENRIKIVEQLRNPDFKQAYEKAEQRYLAERAASNGKQSNTTEQTKTAKIYDVKFEFKRNEKTGQESFKIKVNGVTPATAIKNDPQALEVLKNHPDLKGISDTQIKKGFINDNGGLRPMDMKLDATGKEIQAEKAKEQGFER